MANTITLAKNYIPNLDKIYKTEAVSSILNSDPALARAGANANEIVIPKLSMDGLATYSRNSGYIKGDVNFTWETKSFNYDRGRKFEVDSMDDEETMQLAFGQLGAEFMRTKVAPESDAFTFAKLSGTTGISKVSAGATLATGDALINAIVAAVSKMDEDEVSAENRVLFINSSLYNSFLTLDTYKNVSILARFSSIVPVPQSRFYTAIKLNDGSSSGEIAGGYEKAAAGKDINFLIVDKGAVLKFDKHIASDIIPANANQSSDGNILKYRKYGLVDVYDNKVAGIYLHHKA